MRIRTTTIHSIALILFLSIIDTPYVWSQDKIDTIFTIGKPIIGRVKEVGHLDILYSLPNEDVTYHILKRNVQRIIFSSGRKEVFNDQKNSLQSFNSNLWQNVGLTFNSNEIIGLIKIDLISVKATGTTVYSSVTNTQNRAFRKLKQAAAMLGADFVLVNTYALEGNIPGFRSTRTQLMGTVYRSVPLDTVVLFKNIRKQTYEVKGMKSLRINNSSSRQTLAEPIRISFNNLSDFKFVNDVLYLNYDLGYGLKSYLITYFDEFNLVLAYHNNSRFEELTLRKIK